MKEFQAGDRVVKMSGVAAGKYGTVNSVLDNGTLNVTFDGERRPRYCDPERCGQVAANAKIVTQDNFGTLRVGDHVDFRKSRYWKGTGVVTRVYGDGIIDVKGDRGEGEMEIHEEDILNSRAANATARNGEKRLRTAEDKMGNVIRVGDMVKIDGGKKGKVESIWEYDGEGPYVIIAGSFRPVKPYLFVTKVANATARNAGGGKNAATREYRRIMDILTQSYNRFKRGKVNNFDLMEFRDASRLVREEYRNDPDFTTQQKTEMNNLLKKCDVELGRCGIGVNPFFWG